MATQRKPIRRCNRFTPRIPEARDKRDELIKRLRLPDKLVKI